ncbi:hypothetical protein BO221_07705 [Archangium sp. Cb G35]|uniref:hypothetical protein n=1 Tax=Archangium sp. Cb G35 TaxID=1920190 RepID=UPI0009357CB5|nr:hypothetical protein [Archangium sp. Cb G35]OJT25732.1 hypothetical protein BO221_07705 [Archangium sp. Cb G35]
MPDLFTPLTPTQKADFHRRYLAYLRGRDGEPQWQTHTFSVREAFYQRIDQRPVRRTGAPVVSQDVFDHHHVRYRPGEKLDEPTLWALCVAKTNRGERFGVEYAHRIGTAERNGDPGNPTTYIGIEEFYHTRILRDVLRVIGLEMEMLDPSLTQQWLIKTMARLPKKLGLPLILCGEITGVAMFQLLLNKARELFADQPGPLARIEELFAQIMVDEVGHVHYARSQLDAPGLTIAKWLLPLVARGIVDGMPEYYQLFGRERLMEEVLRADVDAAARPYPDRFIPFDAEEQARPAA